MEDLVFPYLSVSDPRLRQLSLVARQLVLERLWEWKERKQADARYEDRVRDRTIMELKNEKRTWQDKT